MAPKQKVSQVPSKQWSCSELTEGHNKLLQVKKESEGEEALKKKIEEPDI